MGISGYHEWIRTIFYEAIQKIRKTKSKRYSHILIDVNFILHQCYYGSNSKEAFVKRIYQMLDNLLLKFIPTKSLYLTIDGTSTYAKLNEQKARRETMVDTFEEGNFSSLELTPGTELMIEMENYLNKYLDHYQKQCKFRKVKCILSSSKEPDEGEIKIFAKINEIQKKVLNEKCLVIGNDADIIVLGLLTLQTNQIDILFRNKNEMDIISIEKIIQLAREKLYIPFYYYKHQKIVNLRKDLALISILMGNDYVPKITYANSNIFWKSYSEYYRMYKNFIFDTNTLDLSSLKKFLVVLRSNMKKTYQNTFHIQDNKIIKNYLKGIVWCINAYKKGCTYDTDYKYNGPDDNNKKGPSVNDLINFISENPDEVIPVQKGGNKPIPYELYPVLVIPKKAKSLIPKKYHKIMDTELSEYYYEEPKELKNKREKLRNLRSTIEKKRKEGIDTEYLRKEKNEEEKKFKKLKEQYRPKKHSIEEIKKIINSISNI